jgi:hypothetical protein
VDYYLLAEETTDFFESYGVEICCESGESACVRGITCSQNKILHLIALLMKHTVTPVSLRDVVDDWVLS